MSVKLLTEHHLELLSIKGGCTVSSESTLVKIPHCWKSRVTAHMLKLMGYKLVTIELSKLLFTIPFYDQVWEPAQLRKRRSTSATWSDTRLTSVTRVQKMTPPSIWLSARKRSRKEKSGSQTGWKKENEGQKWVSLR